MSVRSREPILRLDGVEVCRGRGRTQLMVLQGASLTVHSGEVVGISGPSGSGKSSMIGVLSGDLLPSQGTIVVQSTVHSGTPREIRRAVPGSIALIAQSPLATLDSLWSIVRCVAEPLRAAGIRRHEAHERALAALDSVGLRHLPPNRLPHELSIGQAQRVCIARALSTRPTLLLADEATSALDVRSAAAVASLLREAASSGTAVIMVSHDHRLLDSICDRRLHLDQCRLVEDVSVMSKKIGDG